MASEKQSPTLSARRSLRKYIINFKFQRELIGYFVIAVSLAYLGSVAGVIRAVKTFDHAIHNVGLPTNHVTFQLLTDMKARIYAVFIGEGVIGIVFIFFGALLISHRIAGQLHRLTCHLREWKENGKFEPIQFRKNDHFHEIAELYNELGKRYK